MVSILVYILVLLLIFGALGWLVQTLPIQQPFKQAAVIVLVLIFILLLLGAIGLIPIGPPHWG